MDTDRPAAEDTCNPLGLNERTVLGYIVTSFGTVTVLLGLAFGLPWQPTHSCRFEDAFAAIDEKEIQVDGRWTWEATFCLEVAKTL